MLYSAKEEKTINGETEYVFTLECPHCKGFRAYPFSKSKIEEKWMLGEKWRDAQSGLLQCKSCCQSIPCYYVTIEKEPKILAPRNAKEISAQSKDVSFGSKVKIILNGKDVQIEFECLKCYIDMSTPLFKPDDFETIIEDNGVFNDIQCDYCESLYEMKFLEYRNSIGYLRFTLKK